jgi:hypothetical protein
MWKIRSQTIGISHGILLFILFQSIYLGIDFRSYIYDLGILNQELRCYERTRDQGTLGSIAIAIVEPLGGHLFMYILLVTQGAISG